jgi:hypothetical protein
MAISKLEAIQSLHPTAQFVLKGGELTWQSEDITEPTDAEITAEQTRLQAEYDAKQYARDRAVAYASIQDQLDMQYWDNVNGTTTWKDHIAKVKSDNPKP